MSHITIKTRFHSGRRQSVFPKIIYQKVKQKSKAWLGKMNESTEASTPTRRQTAQNRIIWLRSPKRNRLSDSLSLATEDARDMIVMQVVNWRVKNNFLVRELEKKRLSSFNHNALATSRIISCLDCYMQDKFFGRRHYFVTFG